MQLLPELGIRATKPFAHNDTQPPVLMSHPRNESWQFPSIHTDRGTAACAAVWEDLSGECLPAINTLRWGRGSLEGLERGDTRAEWGVQYARERYTERNASRGAERTRLDGKFSQSGSR